MNDYPVLFKICVGSLLMLGLSNVGSPFISMYLALAHELGEAVGDLREFNRRRTTLSDREKENRVFSILKIVFALMYFALCLAGLLLVPVTQYLKYGEWQLGVLAICWGLAAVFAGLAYFVARQKF